MISCKVIDINQRLDCIWLQPTNHEQLSKEIQDLDIEIPCFGQITMTLGMSGINSMEEKISINCGRVASNKPDENLHCRIIMISAQEDNGAPIFGYFSGCLLGMNVRSERYNRNIGASSTKESPKILSGPNNYAGNGCFISSELLLLDHLSP